MQLKRVFVTFCAVTILLFGVLTPFAKAQGNGIESLRNTGKAFASVAKKVSPAVVFIKVEKVVDSQPTAEFFSPFGGRRNPFGDDFGSGPFGEDFFKLLGCIVGSGFIVELSDYVFGECHFGFFGMCFFAVCELSDFIS